MKKIKRLAKIFKALSNPHRLEIFLKVLHDGPDSSAGSFKTAEGEESQCCLIQSFIKTLKIGTPTISHHLKELVNAELIETEKYGKFLGCRVNPKVIAELKELFEGKTENEKDIKNEKNEKKEKS